MRAALSVLAGLCAVAAIACGGESNSNDEVEARANQIVLTYFEVFTGKKPPQSLIDVYAPECRQNASVADVTAIVQFLQEFLPGLREADIEAVDLGDLEVEEISDGVRILPADADAMRFRVDGRFVNARDYLTDLIGPEAATLTDVSEDGALTLVRRSGQLYIGDCEDLQDLTE
jgi:hypothetical protein